MTQQNFFYYVKHLQLPKVYYYESIDSTNTFAMNLLQNMSLHDWTLFFAEEQTAGKGRFDRKWITNPASALAFSLVFIPKSNEIEKLSFFSALGGIAICKVLENQFSIHAQLKYPNDVLIDGMKTSGILAEADWVNGVPKAVVLGIGVNVFPQSVPDAKNLNFPSTCIADHTLADIERYQFLAQIIDEIQNLRPTLATPEFIENWNYYLAFKEQPIEITTKNETHQGICKKINDNGDLVIEKENGITETFRVGDVHLRPRSPLSEY
jgi:BirA family biotin operon repressor/biotin-[acetyl-CoA-carboxylase] ligase